MKKLFISIVCLCLMFTGGLLLTACGEEENPPVDVFKDANVACAQVNDQQEISVSWEAETNVDKVDVIVSHNGSFVSSKTVGTSADLLAKKIKIDAYYGKQDVTVILHSGEQSKTFNKKVNVSTDEYNIAPLSGSQPVLLFSLSLFGENSIMKADDGSIIPTYVWFERPGAYDYGNMPAGLFTVPVATPSEIMSGDKNLAYSKTNAWIKELIEMNPQAKINLYINDFDAYVYPQFIIANHVQNYSVTMITDGAASYVYFKEMFNNSNPTETYNTMKLKVETVLEQVRNAGYYNTSPQFAINKDELTKYCYVMAKELENVDWWIRAYTLRNLNNTSVNDLTDEFKTFLTAAYNEYNGTASDKNIGAILTNIEKSEEDVTALKKLYNMSNNLFAKAAEENKKIMMTLGTHVWAEPEYENYAKLTQKFYGNEYIYYYKGHPASPTDMFPAKLEQLKELGMYDVDSTIAAELILFFYPETYMCGYDSSTFNYLDEPKDYALWCYTKAEAATTTSTSNYYSKISYFFSKLAAGDETYAQYMTDATHTYYLVEYADNTNVDFSIYDLNTDTLTSYKDGSVVA